MKKEQAPSPLGRMLRGTAFVAALLTPFSAHAQSNSRLINMDQYVQQHGFRQYEAPNPTPLNSDDPTETATDGPGFHVDIHINESPEHSEPGWEFTRQSGVNFLRGAEEFGQQSNFEAVVSGIRDGNIAHRGDFGLVVRQRERLALDPSSLANRKRGQELLITHTTHF